MSAVYWNANLSEESSYRYLRVSLEICDKNSKQTRRLRSVAIPMWAAPLFVAFVALVFLALFPFALIWYLATSVMEKVKEPDYDKIVETLDNDQNASHIQSLSEEDKRKLRDRMKNRR